MEYRLDLAIDILNRTPALLNALLRDVADEWGLGNAGDDTWSPHQVLSHMIAAEETNWIPRARHLLEYGETKPFTPFDQVETMKRLSEKSLDEVLETFASLRRRNIEILQSLDITGVTLQRRGLHPDLGPVHLSQLLSTWVVHDMNHVGQIVEVMAKQYGEAIGPWKAFLPIVTR